MKKGFRTVLLLSACLVLLAGCASEPKTQYNVNTQGAANTPSTNTAGSSLPADYDPAFRGGRLHGRRCQHAGGNSSADARHASPHEYAHSGHFRAVFRRDAVVIDPIDQADPHAPAGAVLHLPDLHRVEPESDV